MLEGIPEGAIRCSFYSQGKAPPEGGRQGRGASTNTSKRGGTPSQDSKRSSDRLRDLSYLAGMCGIAGLKPYHRRR
jgi:hypothetical protein